MAISSIQEFLVPIFYSRKLLLFPSLHRSLMSSPVISPPPPPTSRDLLQPSSGDSSFDVNIVMVIFVLVCALICSVGLNSIINCAFRCTRLITSDNNVRNQISSSGKVPNAGIDKKALKKFPVVSYSEDLKTPGLETECVICLAEFSPGNKIRVLPKCNHVFHVRCIDKWLSCHTSCPTCRHCLIETCQKISGGGASIGTQSNNAALPPVPPPEVIVRIAPLEPEGMVHNIHGLDEISGS